MCIYIYIYVQSKPLDVNINVKLDLPSYISQTAAMDTIEKDLDTFASRLLGSSGELDVRYAFHVALFDEKSSGSNQRSHNEYLFRVSVDESIEKSVAVSADPGRVFRVVLATKGLSERETSPFR